MLEVTFSPEVRVFHEFDEEEFSQAQDYLFRWDVADAREAFDREAAIEQAITTRFVQNDDGSVYSGYQPTLAFAESWRTNLGVLTEEAARFWIGVLSSTQWLNPGAVEAMPEASWLEECLEQGVTSFESAEELIELLEDTQRMEVMWAQARGCVARAMRALYGYPTALQWALEHTVYGYVDSLLLYLGPPADDEEMEAVRPIVDAHMAGVDPSSYAYDYYVNLFRYVPAQNAIRGYLDRCVARKRAGYQMGYDIICLLEDDEEALRYAAEIPLRMDVKGLMQCVGRFGIGHHELYFAKVTHKKNNWSMEDNFKGLLKLHDPLMIEQLFKFSTRRKVAGFVEDYLRQEGANVIEGLLTIAERRGKRRTFAIEWLRRLVLDGRQELIEQLMAGHDEKIQKIIHDEVFGQVEQHDEIDASALGGWASKLMKKPEWPGNEGAAPEWLDAASLPPLLIEGVEGMLPGELVQARLAHSAWLELPAAALQPLTAEDWDDANKLKRKRRGLKSAHDQALEALEAEQANEFAIELFERWARNHVGPTGQWVMSWMLRFSGERGAARLNTYVRERKAWRDASNQFTSIKFAMDVLVEMGTPYSMSLVEGLSQSLHDESYRRHARNLLDSWRDTMGFDEEEFGDFAVPDFGLDERGRRIFDYGKRQVQLDVKGRNDLELTDLSTDKTYKSMPPAKKSDDRDQVKIAKDEYNVIKKPLAATFAKQNIRMERAMNHRRAWTHERWRAHMMGHPVLGHLSRRLIWEVLDASGEPSAQGSVDEEGNLIDLDMEPIELDPSCSLRLLHPATLDEDDHNAWSEQLADFEIIQPFDQMGRGVFRFAPEHEQFAAEVSDSAHYVDIETLVAARQTGWKFSKSYWGANALYLDDPLSGDQRVTFHLTGTIRISRTGRLQDAHGLKTFEKLEFVRVTGPKTTEPVEPAEASALLFSEAHKLLHDSLRS